MAVMKLYLLLLLSFVGRSAAFPDPSMIPEFFGPLSSLPPLVGQAPSFRAPSIAEGQMCESSSGGGHHGWGDRCGLVKIYQETDRVAIKIMMENPLSIGPPSWNGTSAMWMNITFYMTRTFSGRDMGGILYPVQIGGPFDIDSGLHWLPSAQDGGLVLFNGTNAQKWFYTDVNNSVELLVDATGNPVFWELNKTMGNGTSTQQVTFTSYQRGATDPSFWANFTEADFFNPPTCQPPADLAPVNQTIFVFHPADNFDIAGQDVANELGDTLFLCMNVRWGGAQRDGYQWISKWVVEMLPLLGQYQNCNGYPPRCYGTNSFFIGHESALNMGLGTAYERQCGNNTDVGEWYSMPAGGECLAGNRPGDGTCTWRKVERIKTINGTCMQQGNLLQQKCLADGHAPFPTAYAHYKAAFDYDDPAQGGCPALNVDQSTTTQAPSGTTKMAPVGPGAGSHPSDAAVFAGGAATGAAVGAIGALAAAYLCCSKCFAKRARDMEDLQVQLRGV